MNRELDALEIENIKNIAKQMTEKQHRQFLYRKAAGLGCGGMGYISEVFHVSNATLTKAKKELLTGDEWTKGSRSRAEGAGRKKAEEVHLCLGEVIVKMVYPNTYGIPTQVMKWATMSLRKIVSILKEKFNINVCHSVVQDIL